MYNNNHNNTSHSISSDSSVNSSVDRICFDKLSLEEDYYVHIDINFISGASSDISNVKTMINHFMVSLDSFDPRKGIDYPSQLIKNHAIEDNVTNRRALLKMSEVYYELWQVRPKYFSSILFSQFIKSIPTNSSFQVVLVSLISDETLIETFSREQDSTYF